MSDMLTKMLALSALSKAGKARKGTQTSSGTFLPIDGERQYIGRNISGSPPIVGKDGFYSTMSYGQITMMPFDGSVEIHFQAMSTSYTNLWISVLGYGNELYYGVDTINGKVYTSSDARVWTFCYDVQIDAHNITAIHYVNGDFLFICSSGEIGKSKQSENYTRIMLCTDYDLYTEEMKTLVSVESWMGKEFFATQNGIIYGDALDKIYQIISFTEDSPDEVYDVSSMCFWNGYLFANDNMTGCLYFRPARLPCDMRDEYFRDTELALIHPQNNIPEEIRAVGVCNDYLYIFGLSHAYCIDRNWSISVANEHEYGGLETGTRVLTGDKSLLVYAGNTAYQFLVG